MERNRPKLSLKLPDGSTRNRLSALEAVRNALENQLCLRATYNRGTVILGPQIVYEKHGEPYVDAVVLERDGVRPSEVKLSTFKLDGLHGPVVVEKPLRKFTDFSETDPRYAEKIIAIVSG